MKLLIISAAFPPMRAGEADHVYHICENLAQRGLDVHVITTRRKSLPGKFRFEVHPIIWDWSWRDLWRLRREVRRVSPDAVLLYYIGWIYNCHPMITFIPAVIKRMNSRIRLVTQFANAEGADPTQFSLWTKAFRKCLTWWATSAGIDYSFGTLLRDSHSIIVLSRIHGDRLAERLDTANQKMVLVPPPPILKMCQTDPTIARELGRKRLQLAPEEFVFVYLGYVYPGKGVETLLNAFRIVCQKYANTRLVILGGTIARQFPDRPGYAEEISELPKKLAIDDKVIWLGEYDWDSDQASICLRAVDAAVIPVQGGVQLNNSSLAAAVAHALPVIATQGRVLEDAFLDRENVLLCPPKDVERLAAAMEALINDPRLACRLRKGALEMAAEWFSWSKAMERTISVLGSAERPFSVEADAKSVSIQKRTPKVSVCIPTYNGAAYLSECLDSVLGQTFDDIEILVVDDVSTDESVSIAEKYMRSDKRIRLFVNEKNLGLVGNWNHCVDSAKGEWIKFVFQDDTIAPSCISRMLEASRPNVDLIAVRRSLTFEQDTLDSVRETLIKYVSDHDLASHFSDCSYISTEDFARLMIRLPDRNFIGEPTATMIRKMAFAKFGYFNSNLVSLSDWEYFARVAVNTGLCYINEPLASFRVHNRARSAELRNHWRYLLDTIDSLIIQHDMVYLEPYSPLRVIAANQNPPIHLKYELAKAVRRARWEAFAMHDDGKANAEFWRTLKTYPKLLMFPFGYLVTLGLQKLHRQSDRRAD